MKKSFYESKFIIIILCIWGLIVLFPNLVIAGKPHLKVGRGCLLTKNYAIYRGNYEYEIVNEGGRMHHPTDIDYSRYLVENAIPVIILGIFYIKNKKTLKN